VELTHKRDLVARRPLELTSANAAVKPMRERSAAVIWDELERGGCAREVVLWNAFPWHPYRAAVEADDSGPSGPSSNRKPKRTEVEQGRAALDALLSAFSHKLSIFAVGKVAEDALRGWDEAACAGYIRHPAQGGETLFRAQFRSTSQPICRSPCSRPSKPPRCCSTPTSSTRTASACASAWMPTASRSVPT
jgi:hypothetical protein